MHSMFAVTVNDSAVSDAQYMTTSDTKFQCTDVVLHLNTRASHNKLLNYQRYPKFKVYNHRGVQWQYRFDLKLSDTNIGECVLNCTSFDDIKADTIYLYVVSVRVHTDNLLLDKPLQIHSIDMSDVHTHILAAPHNVDFITKHKGIISQLPADELLLCAGEVLRKSDGTLIYNLQSGALRNNMFKNNENLHYNAHAVIPGKRNADTFHDVVALPVLQGLFKGKLVLDNHLRTNYGTALTHAHVKAALNAYPHLVWTRKKL